MLPHLTQATQSALVDPRSFKTDEEYAFAQKALWAAAKNITELLNWIDMKVTEAEMLSEKEQGKVPDKLREALS